MANDLATARVDLQALTSSPELLALRRISLGTVQHPGLPVRKYLSAGSILTAEHRARISAKVAELRAVSESDDGTENQKSRLALVANMLMAYPMSGGSEESGRARPRGGLVSRGDLTPWAVADTIKRWHRGQCVADHNYRFAPAPAELRNAAMQLLQPAKQVVAHLEAVLNAITIERAMNPAPIEQKPLAPQLRVMR